MTSLILKEIPHVKEFLPSMLVDVLKKISTTNQHVFISDAPNITLTGLANAATINSSEFKEIEANRKFKSLR